MLMDLQSQAGFTESESGFVIRMHFSLNLKRDSVWIRIRIL